MRTLLIDMELKRENQILTNANIYLITNSIIVWVSRLYINIHLVTRERTSADNQLT